MSNQAPNQPFVQTAKALIRLHVDAQADLSLRRADMPSCTFTVSRLIKLNRI